MYYCGVLFSVWWQESSRRADQRLETGDLRLDHSPHLNQLVRVSQAYMWMIYMLAGDE